MTDDVPELARILDGRATARQIRKELRADVDALKGEGVTPTLTVIRVGNDPASEIYVGAKRRAAARLGIRSREKHLEPTISASDLHSVIDVLNRSDDVDGILLQLPLPEHLAPRHFLERIDPLRDVDGFHPLNVGRMMTGVSPLVPCTPRGVIELLRRNGIDLYGKDAVVIGRSNIVGKPMAVLLDKADCTVTLCHTETQDLPAHVRGAEILVVATGEPELVKGDWLQPGVVVVDVGQSRRPDGTLVGDVDFEAARKVASWITPVPGGVGPMTVAMLLTQTVIAARLRRGLPLPSRNARDVRPGLG